MIEEHNASSPKEDRSNVSPSFFLRAAEKGGPKEWYELARIYEYGLFEPHLTKDLETALQWYEKAAETGHGKACYRMSSEPFFEALSMRNEPKERLDYLEMSLNWLLLGAKTTSECWVRYANQCHSATVFFSIMGKDPKAAKRYQAKCKRAFQTLLKKKQYDSIGYYAELVYNTAFRKTKNQEIRGNYFVVEDPEDLNITVENAVRMAKQSLENGSLEGLLTLGKAHLYGIGEKKNQRSALRYFKQYAIAGSNGRTAEAILEDLIEQGVSGASKALEAAIEAKNKLVLSKHSEVEEEKKRHNSELEREQWVRQGKVVLMPNKEQPPVELAELWERADKIFNAAPSRGRPKADDNYEPMLPVKIRLSSDVLDWMKAKGPRYQARLNSLLTAIMQAENGETVAQDPASPSIDKI